MVSRLGARAQRPIQGAYRDLPPSALYREFEVTELQTTAVTTAGYFRDRSTLSAPKSHYRAFSLVVRNRGSVDVTIGINGASYIVPAGVTDVIEDGRSIITEYSATPTANMAAGELYIVERCRSWKGWSEYTQEARIETQG